MGSPEFEEPKEGDLGFHLPEEIKSIEDLEGFFGVSNRDEPVGEATTISPSEQDLFAQNWPQLTPAEITPEEKEQVEREIRACILDFLRRRQEHQQQNPEEG